jgi:hypothetical protein
VPYFNTNKGKAVNFPHFTAYQLLEAKGFAQKARQLAQANSDLAANGEGGASVEAAKREMGIATVAQGRSVKCVLGFRV